MIAPGTSFVYKFTATHSGIFMYHCGTPPVLSTSPWACTAPSSSTRPTSRPSTTSTCSSSPSCTERSDPTQAVDYNKLVAEAVDGVVFNGYMNQYRRVRSACSPTRRSACWVMNDGPSDISSFHVIGTIFDSVYKEGAYLLQPSECPEAGKRSISHPRRAGSSNSPFLLPALPVHHPQVRRCHERRGGPLPRR